MARTLSLIVRNLVFTVVVPGLGGVWAPWWIMTRHGGTATPVAWAAVPVIAAGAALYLWCVWNFASVGRFALRGVGRAQELFTLDPVG